MSESPFTPSHTRVFLSADQIAVRIQDMAAQIDRDYPQGPVYLIAILKGAFIFLSDLARAMKTPARIEFMGISSYGKGKTTSGEVKVTKDLDVSIEGQNVLIVEDIVDTGLTLAYICEQLAARGPRSVRVATLLHKPSRMKKPVRIDYLGFTIEDAFVVGYGLDADEQFRGLPYVATVDEARISM